MRTLNNYPTAGKGKDTILNVWKTRFKKMGPLKKYIN